MATYYRDGQCNKICPEPCKKSVCRLVKALYYVHDIDDRRIVSAPGLGWILIDGSTIVSVGMSLGQVVNVLRADENWRGVNNV